MLREVEIDEKQSITMRSKFYFVFLYHNCTGRSREDDFAAPLRLRITAILVHNNVDQKFLGIFPMQNYALRRMQSRQIYFDASKSRKRHLCDCSFPLKIFISIVLLSLANM